MRNVFAIPATKTAIPAANGAARLAKTLGTLNLVMAIRPLYGTDAATAHEGLAG